MKKTIPERKETDNQMSRLIEVWVTKTYKDLMSREFVFFMGFSCLNMDAALTASLGEKKAESVDKQSDKKWIAKCKGDTYIIEQRTGQPTPPAHKRWSVYDGRFEMHLPKLKDIPDKLF